ncbi:SDR family oxidoreductase [Amycolatopsis anabasis]|uniref:SDR family oxidoreductase n=1 Tax=Amycolatopsis anabasis TaxID=1840409 RepID=UPI00131B4E90|nr:SDR family oxidoreductase [Amycolatopsis anabasis]
MSAPECAVAAAEVAIVTGAARGIGAVTAKLLAARGVSVVAVDRDEGELAGTVASIRAPRGAGTGIGCDVTSADQVTSMVRRAVGEFGHVDVLVNCAGVTRDRLLLTMTDDEWDATVEVNLGGTILCSRVVGEHMKRRRSGHIVNFSSVAADGNAGQANYATAKAAITGFTRALAAEFGPFGVTVNAVAPGFVATAMVDDLADRLNVDRQAFLDRAGAATALGRVASATDIAGVVAFLAGPRSGYVTGQTVYATGGDR